MSTESYGSVPPRHLVKYSIAEVEDWFKKQARYKIAYDDHLQSYYPFYSSPCGRVFGMGIFFNNFLAKQKCYDQYLLANEPEKFKKQIVFHKGYVDVV